MLYRGCLGDPAWFSCGLPGVLRTHGTDAIFDCILYGAVTALLLHYYNERMRRLFINPISFGLALACLLGTLLARDGFFRETLRYSLQSASIAVIIVNVLFGAWELPRRLLSCKPAVFVGRLSYSLYLFHFGVLIVTQAVGKPPEAMHGIGQHLLYTVLYLGCSFGLASASYFMVERRMIAVRKRFRAHTPA